MLLACCDVYNFLLSTTCSWPINTAQRVIPTEPYRDDYRRFSARRLCCRRPCVGHHPVCLAQGGGRPWALLVDVLTTLESDQWRKWAKPLVLLRSHRVGNHCQKEAFFFLCSYCKIGEVGCFPVDIFVLSLHWTPHYWIVTIYVQEEKTSA